MRLAVALAVLACLLAPAAAGAGILAAEDAVEAAAALADAQTEQGVCYGWNITNDFDGVADLGSSQTGPGVMPIAATCERYVFLTGHIHYACASCEDSDSADVGIDTNLSPAPTEQDLRDLGLEAGALTGDEDDLTLLNMIGALPLLAAQTGAVEPVPAETPTAVPASDTQTNRPGSDFVRESWLKLVFFFVLLASGVGYFFYARSQQMTRASRERAERSRREGLARLDAAEAAARGGPPPPPPPPPRPLPTSPPPPSPPAPDPQDKET